MQCPLKKNSYESYKMWAYRCKEIKEANSEEKKREYGLKKMEVDLMASDF